LFIGAYLRELLLTTLNAKHFLLASIYYLTAAGDNFCAILKWQAGTGKCSTKGCFLHGTWMDFNVTCLFLLSIDTVDDQSCLFQVFTLLEHKVQ
jgi:hypothetical protein